MPTRVAMRRVDLDASVGDRHVYRGSYHDWAGAPTADGGAGYERWRLAHSRQGAAPVCTRGGGCWVASDLEPTWFHRFLDGPSHSGNVIALYTHVHEAKKLPRIKIKHCSFVSFLWSRQTRYSSGTSETQPRLCYALTHLLLLMYLHVTNGTIGMVGS